MTTLKPQTRQDLERRIGIALGAVRGYRQAFEHSPNANTNHALDQAQEDLDLLLDLYSKTSH